MLRRGPGLADSYSYSSSYLVLEPNADPVEYEKTRYKGEVVAATIDPGDFLLRTNLAAGIQRHP